MISNQLNTERIVKVVTKGKPVFVRKMRVYELDRDLCSKKFLALNMEPEHKVYVKVMQDGSVDLRGNGSKNGEYRIIPMTADIVEERLTIADHLSMYLDADRQLSGPGGRFTGDDFTAIAKILDGTADNYVVFNNGGGKHFTVWLHERMSGTIEGFREFVESQKAYVFMYKVEGVETILKPL